MDWKKSNNIVAIFVFIFTTIIYTLTVAPTVSFWDCGEFIATAYKMSVPHPPGSPLFLLVGRMFTLLPFPADIGLRVNLISVFSSSITIMLLYLVIVHLVREWKGKLESREDWLTAISSGLVGAFTFAFTHSFWFNAAEAEVYAASMLFTALLIWLSLVWAEKSNERGNEKYLLMISYLVGLAIAVHLLNVLALPFVAMIYYYKRYEFKIQSFIVMTIITVVGMVLIYPGMVLWFPQIAEMNLFVFAMVILGVFALTYWAVLNKKHLLSFLMLSITFIVIGYTSYGIIPIRSALNPTIDENNPETTEKFLKYINREQYGDSDANREKVWKSNPQTKKRYSSTWDFFWTYQVQHMYNRYFMWQFAGMDEVTGRWNFQFWGLPLLIGLIGMVYHFRGDPKHALAVLALFFATGLAIILYLNQPDPQPRERDYSYVGSFFAFAIWIGLGYAGIIEMIKDVMKEKSEKVKEIGTPLLAGLLIVLMLFSPIQLLSKNYHSHNRSGNYVAWDYSYNILMSCDEDGILFTNGDNDTFPLWYLQEVEGIRTDVRIINLSLLNTDWYIRQLQDLEPKVPMNVNEAMLEQVSPIPWKTKEVTLKVPREVFKKDSSEFRNRFGPIPLNQPKAIKFKVKPTLTYGKYKLLRTQDYMILNILAANQWKKPIYFATTVPQSNLVGGLQDYMRMEGLVMRVVPIKDWRFEPSRIETNLREKYNYRFSDRSVYYNDQTVGLMQNYRTPIVTLGSFYLREGQKEKVKSLLEFEAEKMPEDVIPWTAEPLRIARDALRISYDEALLDTLLDNEKPRALADIAMHLMSYRDLTTAEKVLEKVYDSNPANSEYISRLLQVYEMGGKTEKAIALLEQWTILNPKDKGAINTLNRYKKQLKK
jgi:transmembrane protein TMEM260 (protein O-mannosyltransferase)